MTVDSHPLRSEVQQRGGPPEVVPGPRQQQAAGAHAAPLDGLDSLLVRAELQARDWQSVTLQLPQKPEAPVAFASDQGDGGQPQLRSQLTLDSKTGSVVRWEPYSNNSLGRRLRTWFRFAHTGEFYGITGQTVAGLASLGHLP